MISEVRIHVLTTIKLIPCITHLPVPTASSRYMHIKQRTTYDRHYNDNSSAVVSQIRDVGRKLGAEALRKYHDKAGGEGNSCTLSPFISL